MVIFPKRQKVEQHRRQRQKNIEWLTFDLNRTNNYSCVENAESEAISVQIQFTNEIRLTKLQAT